MAVEQMKEGRFFFLEQPEGSELFDLRRFLELWQTGEVGRIVFPQCALGLETPDREPLPILKWTEVWSNAKELLKPFEHLACDHIVHGDMIGMYRGRKRSQLAQVWPPEMCRKIVEGICCLIRRISDTPTLGYIDPSYWHLLVDFQSGGPTGPQDRELIDKDGFSDGGLTGPQAPYLPPYVPMMGGAAPDNQSAIPRAQRRGREGDDFLGQGSAGTRTRKMFGDGLPSVAPASHGNPPPPPPLAAGKAPATPPKSMPWRPIGPSWHDQGAPPVTPVAPTAAPLEGRRSRSDYRDQDDTVLPGSVRDIIRNAIAPHTRSRSPKAHVGEEDPTASGNPSTPASLAPTILYPPSRSRTPHGQGSGRSTPQELRTPSTPASLAPTILYPPTPEGTPVTLNPKRLKESPPEIRQPAKVRKESAGGPTGPQASSASGMCGGSTEPQDVPGAPNTGGATGSGQRSLLPRREEEEDNTSSVEGGIAQCHGKRQLARFDGC